MKSNVEVNAEVISVSPNKIKISVDKLEEFKIAEEKLKVGSYLRVSDNDNVALLAIIENFSIVADENGGEPNYVIDASPIGLVKGDKFYRGGDSLALPPKKVEPARLEDIKTIYESSVSESERFTFSSLSLNSDILVPVNGNRFFNKHIAIVGSSGSGKSHTVAKILQKATEVKSAGYDGLNNSHIAIFDIHSEYSSAFPQANLLGVEQLILPYWLLNSEELEELFLDTEANDHNQRNVFREAIVLNKKHNFSGDPNAKERIHYDSPLYFDVEEVLNYIKNRNNEKKDKENNINWIDGDEFVFREETAHRLFKRELTPKGSSATGTLNGKLINFINRLENKIYDKRLDFLVGTKTKSVTFEDTLQSITGYKGTSRANVTIFDVSGIPFEVLSICVSLISRLIFEVGYYNRKFRQKAGKEQNAPILVVYEEAHKYAPKSGLSKYRASKEAIERIAKEGRKYGVTLLLASQRPSEISETIFSQCSSFISMRLTNKDDQNFVKRLLPDTVGDITNILPSLTEGEALLIGDAVSVPSLIKVDKCDLPPSSTDIKYLDEWRDEWKDVAFESLIKTWGI
ncbi:anti-phage-associated helicase HerA [Thalassotalea sp. PP2-459]|uniref:anti-phage-associated helicase HerA n=1 Tax=Thalassotalea sp. PP2-459 TaxID=1742724 RepID=UPI000944439A|nr:anti-phage-associated helicase HerA [Thalassotalea sp. PP2-459]OKY26321.1 Bipolar DNA helicase [Thalassotalea sp. PP2-459]